MQGRKERTIEREYYKEKRSIEIISGILCGQKRFGRYGRMRG